MNITTWFGSEEDPYNADAWDGYMANKNRTLKTMWVKPIVFNYYRKYANDAEKVRSWH